MTVALRRLDATQLKTMQDLGRELTLVDVRSRREFHAEHLPGAVNVPFGDSFDDDALGWIDKRGYVVVYGEPDAERACQRLIALSYPGVRWLVHGISGWKQASLPMMAS